MNKKLNTLLFVLGATLFNILVTILALVVLMLLYVRFLMNVLPESENNMVFPVILIASIVVSFIVYRFVLNRLISKIKFEDYFDPIIRGRRPPPKRNG